MLTVMDTASVGALISEERNCGNGHYYLAIDHERAIYCEKD